MRQATALAVILMFLTAAASASTIRVPMDAPTIGSGLSLAASGDTVLVACGTYLEHDLVMLSGVVLRSESGEADCVTIDCQNTGTGIQCTEVDNTARIEGFTITGAFYSGMTLSSSDLRITDCAFVSNEANFGGGINCMDSNPLIERCLFQANSAYGDGAISLFSSSPEIIDCTFLGNTAFVDGPGAIWCRFSSPSLLRCQFINNVSSSFSGAIYARDASSLTIVDCTFAANGVPDGVAAISFPGWSESVQVVTGCTFHGNTGGPTIWAGTADLTISNSIIAGNDGEAIAIQDLVPAITCTDIYGNGGGDWTAPIAHLLGQAGNISLDPLFCDAPAHDLTLRSSSPCAPGSTPGCGLIGALPVGCDSPTSVEPAHEMAGGVTLAPCHPNPFNPSTTIRYGLPGPSAVNLEIFDVAGRLVRRLKDGTMEPSGLHEVTWQGRDDRGRELGSGVYLYRLTVGEVVQTRSMTLVR